MQTQWTSTQHARCLQLAWLLGNIHDLVSVEITNREAKGAGSGVENSWCGGSTGCCRPCSLGPLHTTTLRSQSDSQRVAQRHLSSLLPQHEFCGSPICRLSRGASAGLAYVAAAAADEAPPEQVAQVAQAMAQNPGARGMDLAAKMMEKMGWKSGLGLGRNKQVRPLEAGVGLHMSNVDTAQILSCQGCCECWSTLAPAPIV